MKDNILQNIGDTLLVTVNPKISGKVAFSDFEETILGETSSRKLLREFRISSTSGLFWTDWKELNIGNLSSGEYVSENSLIIEIRYTRTGTDDNGVIEFKEIQFIGERESISFVAPTINAGIFKNIIGSDCLNLIESNLFKKLYYRGILPTYITRGENNDEVEDRDFIDLFFSISRFFGMFICFFKRFENFQNDLQLMREQVRQYGIYFDESNITLEELQYLAQHLYDEVRKRGTNMIFRRKGDVLSNGKVVPIDGELIRLLRNKSDDELLYENVSLYKTGWCLRRSSPMYKGTSRAETLNKTKENTEDFQDLSNFVLNANTGGTYLLANYEGKKVLKLKSTASNVTLVGLGRINESQSVKERIYNVDSQMDYEITFTFKVISGKSNKVNIKFGVEGFDKMGEKLNDAFILPNGDDISESFFEKELTNVRTDTWYYVRGIIYSYSTRNTENNETNLGIGNNLYFNNLFTKFILPKIQLSSNKTAAEVNIWDYKIRPLVRGTNIIPLKNGVENSHSTGFIQSDKLFYTYVKNNNNSKSVNELQNIIEKYLYPLGGANIFVFTGNN